MNGNRIKNMTAIYLIRKSGLAAQVCLAMLTVISCTDNVPTPQARAAWHTNWKTSWKNTSLEEFQEINKAQADNMTRFWRSTYMSPDATKTDKEKKEEWDEKVQRDFDIDFENRLRDSGCEKSRKDHGRCHKHRR